MICSIDFETRSAVDLRKTGVYVYAADASTDVWCMAYSWDGEDVSVWRPGMPIDTKLEDWIVEGGKLQAWNANFERVIWGQIMVPRYNWPRTKSKQWYCTMAQASAAGLPRALGQAAAVLGVEEQKDKAGQALMLRMARPRRTNEDGTHVWWETADKVQALIDYCAQDVRTEMDVSTHIPYLPDSERQLFLLDQRINDRGVMLDRDLLQRVRTLADNSKAEIDAEINRLTQGEVRSATQGMHLAAWLRKYGVNTTSVDKQAVAKILAHDGLHPVIRKVVELRQSGAKSSTAKLDAMEYAAGSDDRMRGLLVYHGAATGRWSGKLVQPQNFPRPVRKQAELDEIIEKLKSDEDVSDHGHGTEVAADLLRSMIIAAPNHRLMFADYSAIEARVLAWMAGQTDLVETFAKGGDVYIKMAATVFGVKEENVTPEQRQVGKSLVLGCGFQMSAKRFSEFAKVDMDLAVKAVGAYRETNYRIVAFWKESEELYLEIGRAAAEDKKSYMEVPLPSGRKLTYRNPRIVQRETPWGAMQDTVEIDTLNSITRQWVPQKIWGGLAVENCIAEGTFVLTDNGWKPIENIDVSDKVHDGVDFVSHGGLVSKSMQTCIEVDGVWMTPDHEVLTDDGWKPGLENPRPYRPTFRTPDGYAPRAEQWAQTFLALSMRLRGAVREGGGRSNEGLEERANAELWMPNFPFAVAGFTDPRNESASGVCGVAQYERSLPTSDASSMEKLRRAWNHGLRTVAGTLRAFLGRYGADLSARVGFGSNRQQWSLLAGELPVGYPSQERDEQAHDGSGSGRSDAFERDRHFGIDVILPAEARLDSGRIAPRPASDKQVFDILNAGPRHRFVVLGKGGPFIVHNCVQATARDLMAGAMMRLEQQGYPVIMSVHDEIICEVPEGFGSLDEMIRIMTEVPGWAKGCPIAAEGKEGPRYCK